MTSAVLNQTWKAKKTNYNYGNKLGKKLELSVVKAVRSLSKLTNDL